MANYSTDADLALYEREIHTSNIDTAKYHTEAKAEIDRRLRGRGLTNDQIAHLTAQTIADLVGVSCNWVLYLMYSSIGAHEAAKRNYEAFNDRFAELSIDVDDDADGNVDAHFTGGVIALG